MHWNWHSAFWDCLGQKKRYLERESERHLFQGLLRIHYVLKSCLWRQRAGFRNRVNREDCAVYCSWMTFGKKLRNNKTGWAKGISEQRWAGRTENVLSERELLSRNIWSEIQILWALWEEKTVYWAEVFIHFF